MTYQVTILPTAFRQLSALPRDDQRRIRKKIDGLASNPHPQGAKKLQGKATFFRIRSGSYRIIYTVDGDRAIVLVVRIGHRREVYRGL